MEIPYSIRNPKQDQHHCQLQHRQHRGQHGQVCRALRRQTSHARAACAWNVVQSASYGGRILVAVMEGRKTSILELPAVSALQKGFYRCQNPTFSLSEMLRQCIRPRAVLSLSYPHFHSYMSNLASSTSKMRRIPEDPTVYVAGMYHALHSFKTRWDSYNCSSALEEGSCM